MFCCAVNLSVVAVLHVLVDRCDVIPYSGLQRLLFFMSGTLRMHAVFVDEWRVCVFLCAFLLFLQPVFGGRTFLHCLCWHLSFVLY